MFCFCTQVTMVYRCGCSKTQGTTTLASWSRVVRPESILAKHISRFFNVFPVTPRKFLMLSDMHDSCFLHPSSQHSVLYTKNTVFVNRTAQSSVRTIPETGPQGTEARAYPDRIWNNPASSSVGAIDKTPSRAYDVRLQPMVRNACKLCIRTIRCIFVGVVPAVQNLKFTCAKKKCFLFISHRAQNLHVLPTSGINAPTYFVEMRFVTYPECSRDHGAKQQS
jgi:hypothetical protein